MTAPGKVLENHAVVVRDGRILDILPDAAAAQRYPATAVIQRRSHLVIPGLVNCHASAASSLGRAAESPRTAFDPRIVGPEFVRDGVMTAIAEMLQSGITCFADRYYFPDQIARAAAEQGMRASVGLPVAESSSPRARTGADYLTEALNVRDEYKGHPLISTAFAPDAPNTLGDATFERIATLADELDAAIVIDLHESAEDIRESLALHGMRPIERLWRLGLLTPALNAVHMVHAADEDIEFAQRTGLSISLCPQSSLQRGNGLPPVTSFAASGIRLGLGSGGAAPHGQDIWGEMKLLALMARSGSAPLSAWDVLAVATRGGASVLGLEADVGTLEAGTWADLCCVDLGGPATQPLSDPVAQLVFCGGRDLVSDVWVAGRQLLSEREMTRLDWPAVAARANAWTARLNIGGRHA